jgi:hypothetical protein
MIVDGAGFAVPVVNGCFYLWTFLSPWRLALALLAVVMLGLSALALHRDHPRAKTITLISLWGVLLPQIFWYTEFVVDWQFSRGLNAVMLAGLMMVALPSALLYEGDETLAGWGAKNGSWRLLSAAVLIAWIGFSATEILDHSYRSHSSWAFGAAFLVVPLAGLALAGLIQLRTWSLWVGMAAAVLLGTVALTFAPVSRYGGAGYLDTALAMTIGSGARRLVSAIIPATLLWISAAPFLRCFVRRAFLNRA